jgi:phage protein D/phage baseplate assembly protein gpV
MPSNVVKPRIEIAGSPVAPEIDQLVEQVVVDDSRTLPDMFMLRFRDPQHEVLEKAGLTLGAKVKIFGGPVGGEAKILLISGEVTGLEAEIDETGTHVVARGYDVTHRLQRGRNTRTFVDTSEGEIVRRIASQAGIDLGEIEDPPTTHALVSQANQSDYDFLRGRAREIGFDLAVRGDKLYFQQPIESSSAPAAGTLQTDSPLALVLGANLNAFMPRITAAEQVNEVEVRGWDPDTQQTVLATAQAATTSVTLGDATPATAASSFASESKFVLGDRPLTKSDEVQRVADAVAEQIGSAFAEADGIADGDPTLRAGTAISVAGVGHPFEGRYTVTASRHVIGPGGYRTHFTVSGRQERSLLGLASSGETSGDASAGGAPIYGVVIGIVSDCDDPQKQGRVKLKLPWLSDDYASDWARIVGAGAGQKRGIAFIPEVNDEVLVAFEQGDVRSPFVLGGLWSGAFELPQSGDLVNGGAVAERVLQSRNGHRIVLSDKDGEEGVTLTSEDGSHSVSIVTSNSGTIEIKTSGTVKITGQSIELKGTSVSIKADSSLDLQGATVNVTGSGPTAIKGSPLALN